MEMIVEGRVNGFHLMLDAFCENCGDFYPDVTKRQIQWLDGTGRFNTEIKCENRDKCRRMRQMLEKRMAEQQERMHEDEG